MRCIVQVVVAGLLLLLQVASTYSQTPGPAASNGPAANGAGPGQIQGANPQPAAAIDGGIAGLLTPPPWLAETAATPLPALAAAEKALEEKEREFQRVAAEAAPPGGKPDDTLEKKVELLQKQITVQQKMILLLREQMKKTTAGGPAVDELTGKIATLEARQKQGAQRDVDLAQAVDNLTEHIDAEERNGPRLPAALKELFLASRNNETPLAIYGSLIENYTEFKGKPGVFSTPDFAPYFLLQLNEQFLLAASIDINNGGVAVGEAQLNWIVTDWMTVVLGRFLTPIGFFNERLNHEWINRLPDVPLMFRQVAPLPSTDGLMLRGATYLWGSPVKLEYAFYGGNGLQAGSPPASYTDAVNLENITGGPDETSLQSLGGRVGIWVPEWGFQAGISGYINGRYSSAAPDQFGLWDLDLNYRKGNWDVRFEYADTYQQAVSFIGNNIRRRGYYAQVAYRPYHLAHCLLNKFEVALRYSKVWFHGIDPTLVDPTAFDTPVNVPVNRDQWTFGINYYFYPSMALRLAYEHNHEQPNINLHDDVFLGQFVWAF
jgi:hypothetical protein